MYGFLLNLLESTEMYDIFFLNDSHVEKEKSFLNRWRNIMTLQIRTATLQDVEQIAQVHIVSWKITYRELFSESFLENVTPESRYILWRNNINDPNKIVLVLEKNAEIIGFIAGDPAKQGKYAQYDGDITALYFKEEERRKGYGQLLFHALLTEFTKRGYHNCIVKVLKESNCNYFYKKLGAVHIDDQPLDGFEYLTLSTYAWEKI